MSTRLEWIGEKARKEPKLAFTSLYHHVTDVDNLRDCYNLLKSDKAPGIDGVTKQTYGEKLEENLQDLSLRLKRMGYRPQPSRRTYIEKPGSVKGRPLGISNFEDKIVEMAVKRALEPIYETMFEDTSYGYRPKIHAHACIDNLGRTIQHRRINYIVEADIRSFFDKVNHLWMQTFLRDRIGDPRIIRLIDRMLRAGIMEDGLVKINEEGTPQGSILSPLLSNVYLHYVLDIWFSRRFKRLCRSEAYYFRYADDFLACFENRDDAKRFEADVKDRLNQFNLEIAPEKTQCIEFGRFARKNAQRQGRKPKEFTFLGFTHYCGKTKKGKFKVKRRTSRKKLGQSVQKFKRWAKARRGYITKVEMLRSAKRRATGHLNYYAITDNAEKCNCYLYHVRRTLFKWLNRKSQRRTYTWKGFEQVLRWIGWPQTRIRKNMCPFRPLVTI